MGQGLGENSPVVLSLGRANYEALIKRHGQWVRWRQAVKCPCVEMYRQQPNPDCEKCGGSGWLYDYQKEQLIQTVATADNHGCLNIGTEYENDTLVKVYDKQGENYTQAEKFGSFVMLNSPLARRGSYYNVILQRNIAKTLDSAILEYVGGDFYKVPNIENSRLNIDGIYYTACSDVVSIKSITDEDGTVFTPEYFRQNTAFIPPKTEIDEETGETRHIYPKGTLTAKHIEYIPPFTFALLNQELNEMDFAQMQKVNGSAIVIFPYFLDVAEGDVLTVLAGAITQKDLVVRSTGDFDVLSAFFVEYIDKIFSNEKEYENGVDFVLTGTNRVQWISENKPQESEVYSIVYRVFPTYKVIKNIPQLRSSENQRFPKKAVVGYFDSYSEMQGVNRQ